MALTREEKAQTVKKFQRSELDTGSPEVQVALLTTRIKDITEHFKKHKKDHQGRRGLMTLVNQRRSLLAYLKKEDTARYAKLINDLGLRK